jgi:hypothetical protein
MPVQPQLPPADCATQAFVGVRPCLVNFFVFVLLLLKHGAAGCLSSAPAAQCHKQHGHHGCGADLQVFACNISAAAVL